MPFTRVRALVLVGLLGVAALVVVAVAVGGDSQADGPAGDRCPPGAPHPALALPESEAQVTVRVVNATGTPGLATRVGTELRQLRFRVTAPGDARGPAPDGVGVVRYGPAGVGGAQLVRAYLLGAATAQYDPQRTDPVVDVVLGRGFRALGTPTEMRQSLSDLGSPTAPPGTC